MKRAKYVAAVALIFVGTIASVQNAMATWKIECLTYANQYLNFVLPPPQLQQTHNNTDIGKNASYSPRTTSNSPLMWMPQTATSSNGAYADHFGIWVAMSGDTALVSASDATVNGEAWAGAVYVFNLINGAWRQTQILTSNTPTSGSRFGASLAIDGRTAIIGNNTGGSSSSAYIFQESNGRWTFSQKLVAGSDSVNGYFGISVALDGDYAFVGAPATYLSGTLGLTILGTVYVYKKEIGGWKQTQELIPPNTLNLYQPQGFGISISAQGTQLLIGAPESVIDTGGNPVGEALMYTESAGQWKLSQVLTPSDKQAFEEFGLRVAINGNTAIIGAPEATVNGINSVGEAYVFDNSGGVWTQTSRIQEPNGHTNDNFGCSISMSGNRVAITAPYSGYGAGDANGAAYIFGDSSGAWTLETTIHGRKQNFYLKRLGISGVISGSNALFSAPNSTVNGSAQEGRVEFFRLTDLKLSATAPATVSKGAIYDDQTFATNSSTVLSAPVAVTLNVPVGASFMGATSTAGSCLPDRNISVTCNFGPIPGDGGTAQADITFKAIGSPSATISNTASIPDVMPIASAKALTQIAGTNQAPIADNGTVTVSQDGTYQGTLKASDPDGDYLTYKIVSGAKHGLATIKNAKAGTYTYSPIPGYSGQDSFTFKASDELTSSSPATITVTVKSSTPGSTGGSGSGGGGTNSLLTLLSLAAILGLALRKR